MKTRNVVKIIVGVIVIGGGVSYFMFQAMRSSWSYYYSVDEFMAANSDAKSYSLRIAGKVKPSSVVRDWERANVTFTLAGTDSEIPVRYEGVVPDNFAEDIEVVVEGCLDVNGTFKADTLMTRCESKYSAKVN